MILACLVLLGYLIAGIIALTVLFLAGLGALAVYHIYRWATSR